MIPSRAPKDKSFQSMAGATGQMSQPGPPGMYKHEYRAIKIRKILNRL